MRSSTNKTKKILWPEGLSMRYALISTLSTKLLGFEQIKDMHGNEVDCYCLSGVRAICIPKAL